MNVVEKERESATNNNNDNGPTGAILAKLFAKMAFTVCQNDGG